MSLIVPGEAVAFALTQMAGHAPAPLSITWEDDTTVSGWFAVSTAGTILWVTEVAEIPFHIGRCVQNAVVEEQIFPAKAAAQPQGQTALPSYSQVAQLFL